MRKKKVELISEKQLNELYEGASAEGTEWADGVFALIKIYNSAVYVSDEFYEMYKQELKSKYDYMLENSHLETTKKEVVIEESTERVWDF